MNLHLPVPPLVCASLVVLLLGSCKDQAKESASHASQDAVFLAALVEKDVGEIDRGLPQGATQLAPLVADGADPRQ
ncbi:MAG TPA: hypothetical protein VKU41_25245, partial [Polyangiaceae bacterium]|nr:hypothetical protein [Polyangiaceae bacterium]